jgi:ribosomal protein L11 methyltransferase
MKGRTLFRLVVRVLPEDADAAGRVLVEEGAGGAVQEELPHEARVVCFGESREVLVPLSLAVKNRLREAGIAATCRVGRAPRAFDAWRTEWTEALAPVKISETLWLVPTGSPAPPCEPGEIVWLEPALAFGFGEHATTRMAARAVENACAAGARTMLDFGCGSGVLSLVGAHAGAARVAGVDADPVAVASARRNAALNHTAAKCRFSETRLSRLRAVFDVVVANVDRATLLERAAELCGRVAPGGTLLLTGFLAEDAPALARRYRAQGLAVNGRAREGDWVLFSLGASRSRRE